MAWCSRRSLTQPMLWHGLCGWCKPCHCRWALGVGVGGALALQLGSLVAPSFGRLLSGMSGDGGCTLTPWIERSVRYAYDCLMCRPGLRRCSRTSLEWRRRAW